MRRGKRGRQTILYFDKYRSIEDGKMHDAWEVRYERSDRQGVTVLRTQEKKGRRTLDFCHVCVDGWAWHEIIHVKSSNPKKVLATFREEIERMHACVEVSPKRFYSALGFEYHQVMGLNKE